MQTVQRSIQSIPIIQSIPPFGTPSVSHYKSKFHLRGLAPDIGTNVKFLGSVFLINVDFDEELGNYKGNLGSLGLLWSYKVLKLTVLHLNYFKFFGAGFSFVSLCEYTISNENYLLH
jgi:hypothetical protein